MPKGKFNFDEDEEVGAEEEPLTDIPEEPKEEKTAQAYYEPMMWKNIKQVFRCVTCGTDRDSEDDIILHVVSHLPAEKQIEVLDQLTKKE